MRLKIHNTHKLKNERINTDWEVYDVIETEDEYCFLCWNKGQHWMQNIFLGRENLGHDNYAFNERGPKRNVMQTYSTSCFATPNQMLYQLDFQLTKDVK